MTKSLKKEYRLVWNSANEVTVQGKFSLTSVTGCSNGFDADTEEEITAKIAELGLTIIPDQEETL
jgi:hypothetical protein